MAAFNAQLGDKTAGHARHHLIRVARILVLRARHHQRRPRGDGGQHVVRVHVAGQPGHGLEQRDAGAFAAARFEAADGAADAHEPAPHIHGRVIKRRVAAVRVPGYAHACFVQTGSLQQHAHGALRVIQALAHQRVAVQQSIAHGAVVLKPVVVVRLDAPHRGAPVLEGERVRRQHRHATACERGSEGLERTAHLAGHFTLAEMEFAVVLVEYHHAAQYFVAFRREKEGGNHIVFEPAVLDALPVEPVGADDFAALEPHRHRLRQAKALSKRFAQVGHGRILTGTRIGLSRAKALCTVPENLALESA